MPESKEQQPSRLEEVLGAKPTRVASALFGEGSRYRLAEGKVTVEVYPEIGVTRVATPRAGIELRDRSAARVEGGWVVFPGTPQAAEEPVEDVRVRQDPGGVVVRLVYPAPPVQQKRPDRAHKAADTARPHDHQPSRSKRLQRRLVARSAPRKTRRPPESPSQDCWGAHPGFTPAKTAR